MGNTQSVLRPGKGGKCTVSMCLHYRSYHKGITAGILHNAVYKIQRRCGRFLTTFTALAHSVTAFIVPKFVISAADDLL
jgi:hypothetical protein